MKNPSLNNRFIIAIDGNSASGKTTLGKELSNYYDFYFLDSGKIYRLITYELLINQKLSMIIFSEKSQQLITKINEILINLNWSQKNLNYKKISIDSIIKLNEKKIDELLVKIVNFPFLRKLINNICRKLCLEKQVIVVGRDVGSCIFPRANVKFFLEADVEVRALRKYQLLIKQKHDFTSDFFNQNHNEILQTIIKILKIRDENDRLRECGPLIKTDDAHLLNNSKWTIYETVNKAIKIIRQYLKLPKVLLIGNSNVGKSTLFNGLVDYNYALTSEVMHTTRDFNFHIVNLQNINYELIDSGGIINFNQITEDNWLNLISQKLLKLLSEVTLVLWVVDGKTSLNDQDFIWKKLLNRFQVPKILVINKCEQILNQFNFDSWKRLGIKTIVPISALQKKNLTVLSNKIFCYLKDSLEELWLAKHNDYYQKIKIIILGQPNVGKSTFFNILIKEEKSLTNAKPHTTTNFVKHDLLFEKYRLQFFDTAGLRRKRTKSSLIEYLAKKQIIRLLKKVDLGLFLFSLDQEITVQDRKIIDIIQTNRKELPLLVIGTKKDLIEPHQLKFLLKRSELLITNLKNFKILPISKFEIPIKSKLILQKIIDLYLDKQDI